MTLRVLLVEDSLADARIVQHRLRAAAADREGSGREASGRHASGPEAAECEDWRLERVAALAPAIERLGKAKLDVVLLDLGLPDSAGLETLARLREVDTRVPVVVLTGSREEALGVRALELGAQEHLVKSELGCPRALLRSLRHAIERSRLAEQREALARRVAEAQKMESLWIVAAGAGRAYDRLLEGILEEIDLCFGQTGRKLDAALRAHLTKIRRTALEGERLGERLRCYAEAGRGRGHRTDLSAFVLASSELLEPLVGASAELDLDLAEDLVGVNVDPVQLRQLLVALVLNAMDAIGRGRRGRVRVRTFELTASAALLAGAQGGASLDPGEYVALCVEDDGAGIDPDMIEKVFDPFFTSRERGSGLGLSAALGIARQHGGAIRVDRLDAGGTAVTVLLPFERDAAVDAPPARA